VLEDFVRRAKEEGQGTAFGKALVQRYRSVLEEKGLAPSSINVRLAALRKLATEAADNGGRTFHPLLFTPPRF
jgi:hypothetical protein